MIIRTRNVHTIVKYVNKPKMFENGYLHANTFKKNCVNWGHLATSLSAAKNIQITGMNNW